MSIELLDQAQSLVANAMAAGIMRERQRIIKLLEQHLGYGDSEWDSSVIAVIALIKGESK